MVSCTRHYLKHEGENFMATCCSYPCQRNWVSCTLISYGWPAIYILLYIWLEEYKCPLSWGRRPTLKIKIQTDTRHSEMESTGTPRSRQLYRVLFCKIVSLWAAWPVPASLRMNGTITICHLIERRLLRQITGKPFLQVCCRSFFPEKHLPGTLIDESWLVDHTLEGDGTMYQIII